MNADKQQKLLGISLIALALVIWLDLWWMLVPGALIAAGIYTYRQRRQNHAISEAVQTLMWCTGIAVIYMSGFWLGVLVLAGISLLIRGREQDIDTAIQQALNMRKAQPQTPANTAHQVPITDYSNERPSTGDTTRL
jgi:hypothetical protein